MRWLTAAVFPFALLGGTVAGSEGVDDVIRLEQSHVGDDVLMAYVRNAPTPFDPTAEEIEEMQRAGVSASVIVAMIDHGKVVQGEAVEVASAQPASPGAGASQPVAGIYENPDPYAPRPDYRDDDVEVSAFYAPPGGEVNISFFYGSLAPYGTWQHLDGYGYVWRPRVAVAADWRPYATSGHWVWTDCGWYWESDYPWGWAAFHYGRWHNDGRIGWVWVPDTTWGPAWVNWRRSDRYYGWAPLPPEARYQAGVGFSFRGKNVAVDFQFGLGESSYTFVPAGSFLAADISRVRVPHREVRDVYHNTTVINNTYVYNDNRIVNRGVPVDSVRQATNRQVETVQVTDMTVASGTAFERGEVREGRRIQAFRPAVQNATPETPEKAAKVYAERRAEALKRSPNRAGRAAAQDPKAASQDAKPAAPSTAPAQNQAEAQQRLEQEKAARQRNAETPDAKRNAAPARGGAAQREADAKAKAQQPADEARREQARKAADEKARQAEQAQRKLEAEKAQRERDAKAKAQQQVDEARREQARKAADEQARRNAETQRRQERKAPQSPPEEKKTDAPKEQPSFSPAPESHGRRRGRK
ncbi:MAG: hypothetical protein KIS92_02190 [Planctomycetota bacterium]|nr:hypothetical protein [Planctomycetota bacterium]